ncbi:MAG: rod shape-determining protein MreC [Armatimonadota bacterium]
MRKRRQVARRRGAVVLIVALAGLIAGLGLWQARARAHGETAPFVLLLREFLSPSVRAAGGLRNTLAPDPSYATAPMTGISQARLRALEEENRRLRALLGLRDALPAGALVAEVIGRQRDPWQGNLTIDKGAKDGVAAEMVAITPEGVVGRVVEQPTAHTAVIMPLTDTASHVGALIERTNTPCMLHGDRDALCKLDHLPGTADLQVGDQVVTSGLGSIFPRGLPLGRITQITRDPVISARTAAVQPVVDLSRVEMVVLIRKVTGD